MDVYGLIGNPVGHSLSPPMHEAGFDALALDARYVTLEPATGNGAQAVGAAATLGISGLNVTIPFKEAVLDAVSPAPLAARVGAVNTVVFDDEEPVGYNTDVAGAMRALTHHDVTIDGATAVIIGAGGAGRGIAFGCADRGATIHVANRTVERARDLIADIGSGSAHGLEDLDSLLAEADILINATSVGMESDATIVSQSALHSDLVVMDAVYRPLETRLLRDARECGATTVDGAWMLLFQGAEAFEHWTGQDAPIEPMNAALRDAL